MTVSLCNIQTLFYLVALALNAVVAVICVGLGSSRKELKQARLYHPSDQDTKEQCKFCYACNKYVLVRAISHHYHSLVCFPPLPFVCRNSSHGRMVSCDFCPLIFHLDCLQPPLTIPPSTVWMCPIHPDAKIVSRRSSPSQLRGHSVALPLSSDMELGEGRGKSLCKILLPNESPCLLMSSMEYVCNS